MLSTLLCDDGSECFFLPLYLQLKIHKLQKTKFNGMAQRNWKRKSRNICNIFIYVTTVAERTRCHTVINIFGCRRTTNALTTTDMIETCVEGEQIGGLKKSNVSGGRNRKKVKRPKSWQCLPPKNWMKMMFVGVNHEIMR